MTFNKRSFKNDEWLDWTKCARLETMAKRDYYEVLGLARGASSDEIKKSFRNRARQLHPDNKESGDEAAFKELAEAYEELSYEQKKASYDRYVQ